jgi:hypothetical protein
LTARELRFNAARLSCFAGHITPRQERILYLSEPGITIAFDVKVLLRFLNRQDCLGMGSALAGYSA